MTRRIRDEGRNGNGGGDRVETITFNGSKKADSAYIYSPENNIVMNGGAGADALTGYGKSVVMNGGADGDWLEGHAPPNANKTSSVMLIGGAGNDTLAGGDDSTLLGGAGSDRFRFAPDWYNGNAPQTIKTDFNWKEDVADTTGYGTWMPDGENWVFVPMDITRLVEVKDELWVDRLDGTFDHTGVMLVGIDVQTALDKGVIQIDWNFGKG